jgi:hypothetical protein
MCSRLVHLAETSILTIHNMLLDLLQSLSFVPSWRRAAQLSYSPTQIGGRKIVDDNDISIYTLEELERLESLRVQEFVRTHVYNVSEPTQEREDGCRPSHSLLCRWLEFCDEISGKSTTGGGDSMDRPHNGGIGTRSGVVAFLH